MNNKFVRFLFDWLVSNIFWIIPFIYITICAFSSSIHFNFISFSFWIILSIVLFTFFNKWMVSKNGINFTRIDDDDKSIKSLFKGMPYWEKIHWIPVLCFLLLTLFATIRGLRLLYLDKNDFFIIAFPITIIIVLLFLLLMISRGKLIAIFSIFYILFDLSTAFSYNYIHFYDNISATQNMDRDVRACEMYFTQQRPVISHINESVINDTIKSSIEKHNRETHSAELQKRIENTTNITNDSIRSVLLKQRLSESRNYEKKINNDRYLDEFSKLKGIAETCKRMLSIEDSITILINKYKEDKDNFTRDHLMRLRKEVSNLDESINIMNNDSLCIAKKYTFNQSNDTISWAIHRLKEIPDDRFSSLNKLIDVVGNIFNKDNQDNDIAIENESTINNPFIKEDKQFENRLIYLSVMQSATIDIIPLLLSLSIAIAKRRKYK